MKKNLVPGLYSGRYRYRICESGIDTSPDPQQCLESRYKAIGTLPARYRYLLFVYCRVADPDPVGPGPFWSDPDPEIFHIRIRILSVHWQCKVVPINKEKYFKNRGFTHFQVNFSIFSDKINHHSNIRRNMFD